jgi:hypothetical protein
MAVVALLALAGCGNPGGQVNADPNASFDKLMKLPDIDQAAKQYEQLGTEITQALTSEMPAVTPWNRQGDALNAACANEYPGLNDDGQNRSLPDFVAEQGLTDDQWERALTIIGQVAQKYGFTPSPQRLYDKPNDHDAAFHSVGDDGRITLGTAKHTVLGFDVGCHLTAVAKARGHLAPPRTY